MLDGFNNMPFEDRIIVAIDCGREEALELAHKLSGKARWLKVGMTLYYACGPSIVREFKDLGFNVFLDLKLHDIPFQVEGAARAAALTGADMITMHTLGGPAMLAAGQRGVDAAAGELGSEPATTLGITVLTSMDEAQLASIGIDRSPAEQVRILGEVARQSGISGVVASAQEASLLRGILGDEAHIVTPGVRPLGSDAGDQSRITTPAQAFSYGASHIVIGRPITKAEDPVKAFEDICKSLA